MDRRRTTLFSAFFFGAFALTACGSDATPRASFGSSGSTTQTGDGTEPTDGTTPGTGATTATPDKPGCAQSLWSETLPTKASLSGIAFSTAKANDYLMSALEARYPLGKDMVQGGLDSTLAKQQGSCIDRFLTDKSSAAAVLQQAPTVVHECGHFVDLDKGSGSTSAYVVKADDPKLTFTCRQGDTTSRGGKTFARSLIKTDAFYNQRKACGGTAKQGCDFYADVYLDGSATNSTFEGGDQGYNSVLEETNQYVNSLATALAFQDQYKNAKVSERDGILTFLWYLERYLKMAREDYPTAYATISKDACWRQATLSVWDRAWFYLDAAKDMDNLSLDADTLTDLVNDATLTAEIDALRKLECQ